MVTIPQIICFFLKRKISPENIPAKSVFGKLYFEWLNSISFVPDGYKWNDSWWEVTPPIPYEQEYLLTNDKQLVSI